VFLFTVPYMVRCAVKGFNSNFPLWLDFLMDIWVHDFTS